MLIFYSIFSFNIYCLRFKLFLVCFLQRYNKIHDFYGFYLVKISYTFLCNFPYTQYLYFTADLFLIISNSIWIWLCPSLDCFFRFFSSKNRRHSLRTSILYGFMCRLRLAGGEGKGGTLFAILKINDLFISCKQG